MSHRQRLGWAAIAALAAYAGHATAGDAGTDYAEVLDVRPVYGNVQRITPVERCHVERRPVAERRASATGPILGAIIGGALGNAIGHKRRNKQVGAVLGAALGGSVGYDVSRRRHGGWVGQQREREVCEIVEEAVRHERLLGYDVSYRYAGRTYSTRLNEHPGHRMPVRVRVTPVG